MLLARLATPRADWLAAQGQLSDIARDAAEAEVAGDDLIEQARVLGELLVGRLGYRGDSETYDDFANANLIRVVERRRGLPVALGVLWLHAAHAAGWDASGVNLPGHFVVALRGPAVGPLVLDPFRGGGPLDVSEVPGVLLAPMRRREVLLRLQNNIRIRLAHGGDLAGAAACAQDMLRFAPDALSLWLETAAMHRQLDDVEAALAGFARVVALAPDSEPGRQARIAMEQLRARLH